MNVNIAKTKLTAADSERLSADCAVRERQRRMPRHNVIQLFTLETHSSWTYTHTTFDLSKQAKLQSVSEEVTRGLK